MKTIKESIKSEIVEKKSKFIANIYFAQTMEEAENIIKETKKKYYDARHNCSSYRVLEKGNVIEKYSDDGEPAGTAGAPMLNILQKKDLVNVVVIVTRYFGGILLGTGGLVRAYSEVTQKAIEEAGVKGLENSTFKTVFEQIGKRLTKDAVKKSIPGVSAVIGAAFDVAQMNTVLNYADVFYNKRFLLEKENRISTLTCQSDVIFLDEEAEETQ